MGPLATVLFIVAMLMLVSVQNGQFVPRCPGCQRARGHAPDCHFHERKP